MRYHYETVLRPEGKCFKSEEVTGPVVDSVFHIHPEPELTWVESSFGVRFIGDNISAFRENDLVLIGSMLPHHYINSPRDSRGPKWSRLKVIKFGDEFMKLLTMPEFAPIRAMVEKAKSGLTFPDDVATRVAPLFKEVFAHDDPLRLVKVLELLAQLAESKHRTLSSAPSIDFVSDDRMGRVLKHIHDCLHKGAPVSLAGAAKAACMTPQAFSRYFHKGTRKRFIDYVNELKIGRVCGLLVNTDLPILEISLAAGFQNLSNFNRRFSRLKNLTPRQYRKAFRDHQSVTGE